MPRLEFGSWEHFRVWLESQVKKYNKVYKLYLTEHQEVIAMPVTSTRPTEYGYYNFEHETGEVKEGIVKLVQELASKLRLDLFRIKEIAWNAEREPRIKSEE